MDNRYIEIYSEGIEDFKSAIKLGFGDTKEVMGYKIKSNSIIIFSTKIKDQDYIPLPYKMNIEETTDFIWGWLKRQTPSGEYPDTDGDVEHGFMVYNHTKYYHERWEILFSVKPIWAVYGK